MGRDLDLLLRRREAEFVDTEQTERLQRRLREPRDEREQRGCAPHSPCRAELDESVAPPPQGRVGVARLPRNGVGDDEGCDPAGGAREIECRLASARDGEFAPTLDLDRRRGCGRAVPHDAVPSSPGCRRKVGDVKPRITRADDRQTPHVRGREMREHQRPGGPGLRCSRAKGDDCRRVAWIPLIGGHINCAAYAYQVARSSSNVESGLPLDRSRAGVGHDEFDPVSVHELAYSPKTRTTAGSSCPAGHSRRTQHAGEDPPPNGGADTDARRACSFRTFVPLRCGLVRAQREQSTCAGRA